MPAKSALLEEEKALQERLNASDDDADSSDDDNANDDAEDDMKELKKAVTEGGTKKLSHGASLSRKLRSNPGKTVLYLGHLPREFEEKELAHFLKQFGRVVNLRIARSKRTGNPKGYGFVQMNNEDTARIVADTLAGYILMGQRRLVCHVVPPEKVHSNLFYHAKPPKKAPGPNRSLKKIKAVTAKLVARERKKKALLKEAGIDYDFPGYEAGKKNVKEESSNEAADKEVVERGRKKRKESIDASGKKKRSDSTDSSSKRHRSESVDSAGKKKRSDSVDSVTKKKRSSSVDSAGKKKKDRKESLEKSDDKVSASVTPTASKKRSDLVDSTGKKKKRADSVDSASKKQTGKQEHKKKRKEEEDHDESPKLKKRKNSVDRSEKSASAVKAPAAKSQSKSKKSKRRSI
eukprot:scaffold3526_cov153-Amphora_coffeaeformis.AAC.10